MKIILEVHRYAPELNKAYLVKHGQTVATMKTPGCKSIAEVRREYFAPLKHTGRFVMLHAENVPEHASANRTRSGFCNDMHSLKGALKVFRGYHNLPGCKHVVKTKLIG
jgi:hypothetical protein